MGNRAQVAVQHEEGGRVYLYTHSLGGAIGESCRKPLPEGSGGGMQST